MIQSSPEVGDAHHLGGGAADLGVDEGLLGDADADADADAAAHRSEADQERRLNLASIIVFLCFTALNLAAGGLASGDSGRSVA